jgi:hypothetical protein
VAPSAQASPKAMSAVFSAGSAEAKEASAANRQSKAFVDAMASMGVPSGTSVRRERRFGNSHYSTYIKFAGPLAQGVLDLPHRFLIIVFI